MRRSSTSLRTSRSVTPRCSASFGMSTRCGSSLASRSVCLQRRSATPHLRASSTPGRDDFLARLPLRTVDRACSRQVRHQNLGTAQTCQVRNADPAVTRVRASSPPGRSVEQRCVLILSEGSSPGERSEHVFSLYLRVVPDDLVDRVVGSQLPEQRGDRHPRVPDARQSAHSARRHRDAWVGHRQEARPGGQSSTSLTGRTRLRTCRPAPATRRRRWSRRCASPRNTAGR